MKFNKCLTHHHTDAFVKAGAKLLFFFDIRKELP